MNGEQSSLSSPVSGWRLALAGALGSLLLGGCALPPGSRMAAPADIAPTAEVLDVGHRSVARGLLIDESFDVGLYRVHEVRRGSTSNRSGSIGALSATSTRESFGFSFTGRQDWQGRCEYRSRGHYLQVNAVTLEDRKDELDCSCQSGGEQVRLHLQDQGRPLRGEMQLGQARYAMLQYAFGNSDGGVRSPAVGYRVEPLQGGAGVAAVEVLHPGRIWQQRDLPAAQREPMACLLSALMIYGPQ